METIKALVAEGEAGQRLDRFLSGLAGLSRTAAQNLIEQGNVLLNGKPAPKSYKVEAGDVLKIHIPLPREAEAVPQNIPLDIVFEDDWLLVVNKPKGMVVHPAPGNPDGTLVNAVLYHCEGGLSGIGGELRPGIVHRIDKDTSGLLVVAKDDATHQHLAKQFANHSITRTYHAVVYGNIKQEQGEIEGAIGRDVRDRKKMAIARRGGKNALTHYKVLRRYKGFTYLALQLETGRTHQIRVHMASVGHPVAGDAVYGPHKVISELHGQCLHAKTLGFIHPATGEFCLFDSDLPGYFTRFLQKIEKL